MRRPSRKGLSLAFVLCARFPLAAQDFLSIGTEKPFSFAGGISLNQICYAFGGIASRRDPHNYFASGNINASLYGWSVPLSFNVSKPVRHFLTTLQPVFAAPCVETDHPVSVILPCRSPLIPSTGTSQGRRDSPGTEGNWKISALCGRFFEVSGSG